MDEKILQDRKNGKNRPWLPKKIRSMKVAESMHRTAVTELDHKRANRIWWCASYLAFLISLETGEKKLKDADFCRDRMCPTCQWRKSMKVFNQVSRIMDRVQEEQPELVPVFLTLTLRNCTGDKLSETLDNVFQGWNRFTCRDKIKRIVQGWFRALEITYNRDEDTYHPHLHIILLVDKGYFKGKDYMHTTEWVQMWRKSMKLDYDPICDIRKVKYTKGKHKPVAEVAKYTLKDTEFVTDDNDLTDKLVSVLSKSLRGRRLFALGGLLKQIAQQIGIEELAEGSLIDIDDADFREDMATAIELYRWNMGLCNYAQEVE